LGRLVGRSESWVSQVERGVRTVDRISVLAQVADALNVPVGALAPDVPSDAPSAYSPYVAQLRRALTGHPALVVVLDLDEQPVPTDADIDRFAGRIAEVWRLVHQSRYGEAGPLLIELIPLGEKTIRSLPAGERRTRVYRIVSTMYQSAAALLAKLGDTESGWIASDRALMAAEHGGDPLLVVAGQYRLAQVLMEPTRLNHARYAAQLALEAVESHLDDRGPEAVSLWGSLHLALAVIAAREGNRGDAWSHLKKAAQAAAEVGDIRNGFETEFSLTNVRLHEVAVAVELGDAGEALDRAAHVDASMLSAERRARFLIDLARAYGQRRKPSEAVASLLEAEAVTADQVRDHPRVRELVTDLLRAEGGDASAELKALAQRVGVPA
jgi:transcriptional regulator with XRE-family HTH domain